MSPRIALITACSDSPSKLKVVSPVVPARFGGGEAATALLIVRPVPRRICACGRLASSSGKASADTGPAAVPAWPASGRSEEHTSELQSLMRISYAVFCLKKKKQTRRIEITYLNQHHQNAT